MAHDENSLPAELDALVDRLQKEAEARQVNRKEQERIWVEDLMHLHGEYDSETLEKIGGKSRVFMNKTREKTNAQIARVDDILFPTDERNWAIAPSEAPEMANGAPVEEASDRADAMAATIDDQLQQCRYQEACREQLDQGFKIGTGIKMGPLRNQDPRMAWVQKPRTDEAGAEVKDDNGEPMMDWAQQTQDDTYPRYTFIDAWNFYPSSDATDVWDSDGFYILHPWTKRLLRRFARMPGVSQKAVVELLQKGPGHGLREHLRDLRFGTGSDSTSKNHRFYHVWQYVGPLDAEDMALIAHAIGDQDTMEGVAEEISAADALKEMQAIVWFCDGVPLRLSLYPLDSGEPLFTRFCPERKEGSFWGYGVPRLMRDDQLVMGAGWRMMIDNADLSAGGMLVIDKTKVKPEDGTWELFGRKVWSNVDGKELTGNEFQYIEVPIRQDQLSNLIELARRSIDEGTSMPMLAQGEQGTQVTQTAAGMALLLNAANVVLRKLIKSYDDNVTEPEIRRVYDWNMQFNPDESIKGDFEVSATGASSLLVKSMQAQNLMALLLNFGDHPKFGMMLKDRAMFRKMISAFSLDSGEVVLTDEEIDAALGEQQAPSEIEVKAQMAKDQQEHDKTVAALEANTRMDVAELAHETAMMNAALQFNITMEEMEAKLADQREARASKERTVAAEIGVRSQPTAPVNRTQIANA